MSRICTKCKEPIPDTEQLGPVNEKYPVCTKCWSELEGISNNGNE